MQILDIAIVVLLIVSFISSLFACIALERDVPKPVFVIWCLGWMLAVFRAGIYLGSVLP